MKSTIITATLILGTLGIQAGTITYKFEDGKLWGATKISASDITAGNISYVQGNVSGTGAGESVITHEAGILDDNFYGISSQDMLGDPYAANVNNATDTHFRFSMTADAGKQLDFSTATIGLEQFAVNDHADKDYALHSRFEYSMDGGTTWSRLTTTRKTLSAPADGTGADHTTTAALVKNFNEGSLGGYTIDAIGADVYLQNVSWSLSGLGTLAEGSTIDFAVYMYDSQNGNGSWWAGADDINVTGVTTVVPEPATLGLIAAFGTSVLFIRRIMM